MEILKKIFPNAYNSDELKGFLLALVVYILIDAVCGVVASQLTGIPVVGAIFGFLSAAVGLYAFVGIVLSVLVYFKVVK